MAGLLCAWRMLCALRMQQTAVNTANKPAPSLSWASSPTARTRSRQSTRARFNSRCAGAGRTMMTGASTGAACARACGECTCRWPPAAKLRAPSCGRGRKRPTRPDPPARGQAHTTGNNYLTAFDRFDRPAAGPEPEPSPPLPPCARDIGGARDCRTRTRTRESPRRKPRRVRSANRANRGAKRD